MRVCSLCTNILELIIEWSWQSVKTSLFTLMCQSHSVINTTYEKDSLWNHLNHCNVIKLGYFTNSSPQKNLKLRTWLNQIRIVSFLVHLYTLHINSIQIFFFLSQSSNKWHLVFMRVFTLFSLSHYFQRFNTFQMQLKLWEYDTYTFPVTRGSFIGHLLVPTMQGWNPDSIPLLT